MAKAEVAEECLGICFEYSHDYLFLSQKAYVEKVLNKFKMTDSKPCDTPLVLKSVSSDFEAGESFSGPYRELIGALLYLATGTYWYIMATGTYILYSVNCLSQIQEHLTVTVWACFKSVSYYLK